MRLREGESRATEPAMTLSILCVCGGICSEHVWHVPEGAAFGQRKTLVPDSVVACCGSLTKASCLSLIQKQTEKEIESERDTDRQTYRRTGKERERAECWTDQTRHRQTGQTDIHNFVTKFQSSIMAMVFIWDARAFQTELSH